MTTRNSLCVALALAASLAIVATDPSPVEARPRPRKAKKFSANKTFGLGIMLGAPTGLSGKYFYADNRAFDFGIGGIRYYRHRGGLHIHADHLWHPVSLASTRAFELPLYIGVGGRIFDYHDDRYGRNDPYYNGFALGVRIPFGIAFDFNEAPLDIFIEIVPVVDFFVDYVDTAGFDVNGAIGIRYYF